MRRLAVACGLALAGACADGERAGGSPDDAPQLPEGIEVVERAPDPAVVADGELRARLEATGLPWRIRHAASGIELLLVPPGEFERGASETDGEAADDERPAHPVVVAGPFYLGRYEVTQNEWRRVMGDEPSFFPDAKEGRGRPVEQVPCFRAVEFVRAAGLTLPTESQWEYACRAGDTAPRHGPLDEVAWHRGNARGRTQSVGERRANRLGFHDMLGNVWEWTASGFMDGEYRRHRSPIDARAVVRGLPKVVLRGGSYYDPPRRARASARYAVTRDFSAGHVGLRVALEL